MKKFVSSIIVLGALSGCSGRVLDYRNVEISSNKIFADGENEPFTGLVTNFPLANLPAVRVHPLVSEVVNVTKERAAMAVAVGTSMTGQRYGGANTFCDVKVKRGVLHGKVVCKVDENEVMRFSFDDGNANGEFEVFDPSQESKLVAEGKLVNGVLFDKAVGYSASTGKVVFKANYIEGKPNFAVETFYPDTGNPMGVVALSLGVKEGETTIYWEDGKTVKMKGSYVRGYPNGMIYWYDRSGNQIKYEKFVEGQLIDYGKSEDEAVAQTTEEPRDGVAFALGSTEPQQESESVSNEDIVASFDCAKASTRIEMMICGSVDLAALDKKLGDVYAFTMLCSKDPAAVKKSQRSWIKNDRDVCEDAECITTAMNRQLSQLQLICR